MAGFWDNVNGRLSGGAKTGYVGARDAVIAGGSGVIGRISEPTGKAIGAGLEKVGKAGGIASGIASGVVHPVKGPVKATARFGLKAGKVGLIGAAIIGGIAAVGVFANNLRSNRAKATRDEIRNAPVDDVPPLMTAADLAAMQQGPADGRAPNEWQSRVRPGAAQVQGPANPAMTAVDPNSVQDLGATPTR
jgi:hypothetical protein